MQALKRKKMLEGQRDQMMTQSFNLQQTTFTVETMKDTALQIEAMRGAQQAMQEQMNVYSLDDVEDIYDEMQDMMDMNNEIQELMSRTYEMPFDIDESELEQELQSFEMEQETELNEDELPSYLTDMSAPISDTELDSLPNVPSKQPVPSLKN